MFQKSCCEDCKNNIKPIYFSLNLVLGKIPPYLRNPWVLIYMVYLRLYKLESLNVYGAVNPSVRNCLVGKLSSILVSEIIRMSTLLLTSCTRVSNLFLIELILICAIIIRWRFDLCRNFSLFLKNSDPKFGFRTGGLSFETLFVQTSLFDVIPLLLIFTKDLLISYHLQIPDA